MPDRLSSIGHIAIVSRDFERLAAFYADVFAAQTSPQYEKDKAGGLGFIQVGETTALHVFERPEGDLGGVSDDSGSQPFSRGRIDHFSVEAASLPAFVAIRDRLIDLEASDGRVVDFGPLVSLFAQDPDGFGLEVSLTKPPGFDPPFELAAYEPRSESSSS